MAHKDGVDELAPPRSHSGGGDMVEMITHCLGVIEGSSGTAIKHNKEVEEAVHPLNNLTLPASLDFLGLPERDTVLEVLASNSIDCSLLGFGFLQSGSPWLESGYCHCVVQPYGGLQKSSVCSAVLNCNWFVVYSNPQEFDCLLPIPL
ncbi:hypothetical protein PSHT_11648 [Puccinia striiformis]|uniref:Uncharacterized protein n=1 Tax=Puccinia striiformis TaxID=27350 RepID=A0A2S4V242_9BASI|nr:hypothetical protein PSHT_11648 [Puccinia striiformis]